MNPNFKQHILTFKSKRWRIPLTQYFVGWVERSETHQTHQTHQLARWTIASTLTLLSIGVIVPATAQTNLIKNGSFEQGVDPGRLIRRFSGSTDIHDWKIQEGNVDYIGTLWQHSDGQRSLEIPGDFGGATISQSFLTEKGQQYQVQFALSGTPLGHRMKVLTVSAGAESQDFYFDIAGHNFSQMGWLEKTFVFTATRTKTTLTFTGERDKVYGAVLDNIRVFPVQREIPNQPDLTIFTVSTANLHTDLQTLQISGSVDVILQNLGTAASPAHVTLFEDTNHNGVFDNGVDNQLGSQPMPFGLATEESLTMEISVNGSLAFRDSPIYAMVDSQGTLDEADEDNNFLSTAHLCQMRPDKKVTFEPELKWAWTGSSVLSSHNQVISTPVVAPLEDSNGDGKINQLDTPSVIFHTFSGANRADGVLRAVSGKYGHELWTVSNPSYRTSPGSNIAVADIDSDGIVEIIVSKNGGGLIAFEHTGEFKWNSTVSMPNYGDAVSIADLEGDGNPEIIFGNTVLNADGTLKWQGNGFKGSNSGGVLSVVADINLDGKQEVIAGAAAYSSTGERLWQNDTVGDGFVGIGNFNDDDYPEIVVVSFGRLFLLNHDGNILWGPISILGGGYGGAPTVADMDGDGTPEIGVVTASRYVVYKADSTVLWASITDEDRFGMTGSSVFDFDGDGQVEVVYADSYALRIYRGRDGTVLFQTPNRSVTGYEYPVIADIDNDNHADIVVANNGSSKPGIYVYQDKRNSWVNTRKIWNQHSYHVTNINDDGTVPAVEPPSWLTHNTYRLNTLNSQNAEVPTFAVPDLTASQLQQNGTTISVLIGNAGLVPVPAGVKVRFYENNHIDGDKLLGDISMDSLDVGASQTIVLENVNELTENATLYAFVDADEVVGECNEFNNTAWKGPSPTTAARAECKFYAINDKGKNQSQFLVFDVDSRIENFIVRDVGPLYKGYDIEALSINPTDYRIYATSGYDVSAGKLPGQLYAINAETGALIPIGATGFEEVDSLTFAADGTLWGWAKEHGLITINLETGQGTLELPAEIEVEDLALAKTETLIFYGAVNTDLWRFQPDTDTLEIVCNNLPGETESLEMLSENLVLLGTHDGDTLQVFDIKACETTSAVRIPTGPFKDVEGLGVIEEQCPLGEMVETALKMIEKEQPVCLSLEQFEANDSVEGFDVLYPGLSLMTYAGKSIAISEGKAPMLYANLQGKINACIDKAIGDKRRYHNYTFLLESGLTFREFSLRTLDFGDANPYYASQHSVSLVGYNGQERQVAKDTLSYQTINGKAYRDGEFIGRGDACLDEPGQLGRYQYQIAGSGISKVKLKYYNNKTGQQPSDPAMAIGDICFTLERLPIKLLRHLPSSYINDRVNEFIGELRHERMGQFSRWEIIQNLVELQSQYFREYIDGFPSALIQEFFNEKLYRDLNGAYSDYPSWLVKEILEEFPQDFQDRFREQFPDIEETVRTHLSQTQSNLIVRYQDLKDNWYFIEIPIDGLRNVLSSESSNMIRNLTSELVMDKESDESLLDVLDALPKYILNKMLDNNE